MSVIRLSSSGALRHAVAAHTAVGHCLFGVAVPYHADLMLPYLLSIAAQVLVARRAAYPQALMKPDRKGEQ